MLKNSLASLRFALVASVVVLLAGCGTSLSTSTPTTTPVTLVTASLPAGTVGTAYGTMLVAANGAEPYSFAVTAGSLPAGLSLASTGLIAGTPTQAAVQSLTVTVTDASSQKASAVLTLTVVAQGTALSITTNTLAAGNVGSAYSGVIVAAGGTAPYQFKVTSGTLPAGLVLSSGGQLVGTPAAPGTSNFTVTVTDAGGKTASAVLSLVVGGVVPVSVVTATLPAGTVGTPYSVQIVTAGGTAPYNFSLSAGNIPGGLILNDQGLLAGTPTGAGTTTFSVTVTDAKGVTATANYTLVIAPAPLYIATGTVPSGAVGTAYSAQITATGGTTPYRFSLSSGSLPGGLTLNNAGLLAGTPTGAGTFLFVVTVTDAAGQTVSGAYSLTIAPAGAVTITTSSVPAGTVGAAYSTTIAATGGTAPYHFSLSSGSLPGGLTLNSAGSIAGTPTGPGTTNFGVTVTDATGATATAQYTLVVAAAGTPVSIATTSLASGTVGRAYSATLVAANGTAPYSFAVTSGSLPAGLSLSSGGVISGTPTAAGPGNFTVTVTDAASGTASASFSIAVAAATTAVSITTSSLPAGTVGAAYSSTISAANGTAPYSFAVTSGALPAGLSLSSAGVISGSPMGPGTSGFNVTVTDAQSKTASASFSVTVVAANNLPVQIVTTVLPSGTVGTVYNGPILVQNGTAPYSFAVTGGALPTGLSLSASGVVVGTPTTAGPSSFTVTVTDAKSGQASATFALTIGSSSIAITNTTLPNGTVGVPYSGLIQTTGGVGPLGNNVTSGTLPPGLTLWADFLVGGTPTSAGTYTFGVTAIDNNYQTAYQSYTVTIAPALTLATSILPAGIVGTAYSSAVVASNGTAPYAYAVIAGSMPGGVSLSAAGALTGTPTAAGTSNFTVGVTDANSLHASASYSIAVAPVGGVLTISNTALGAATVNAAYAWPLDVSGGTGPYTVSLTSGVLPPGVTLSASGLIAGTPTATGTYPVSVKAVDSGNTQQTATVSLSLLVVTATVQVNTAATIATVPQTFFGMHTSVYDGSLNDSSALAGLLPTSGVTMLRFPGGSYSDRYHWAQHSLTPAYASSAPACNVGGPTFEGYIAQTADFGDFVRTMQASGAQGVITVNYGTSVADANASKTAGNQGMPNQCSEPNAAGQPEEAAAWVAYANGSASSTQVIGVDAVGFDWKTVGFWAGLRGASPLPNDDGYNFLRLGLSAPIGIKFWELGNEMYYNGWSGNRNYEADLHAPFIYPQGYNGGPFESRDQLPALSPTAYGTNAAQFVQAMKAVDSTISIGLDFASPGATDPIPLNWNPDLAQAACAAGNFDVAIIHYYPGTYNAVQPGELLSLPEYDLPRQVAGIQENLAQYCPGTAPNIKFMLTETSPNGTLASNFPQQMLGLFALNEYMVSLETGIQNIDWLELHDGNYLTTSETPGPVYYGIELAHLLAGVGDSVVQANSSNASVLSFATLKANGQKGLMLVNADPANPAMVQVTVAGSLLGANATEYSYGVSTSQSGSTLMGTAFGVSGNTFTVTVAPYTAIDLIVP